MYEELGNKFTFPKHQIVRNLRQIEGKTPAILTSVPEESEWSEWRSDPLTQEKELPVAVVYETVHFRTVRMWQRGDKSLPLSEIESRLFR